jgi:Glycosyltransferase family 87
MLSSAAIRTRPLADFPWLRSFTLVILGLAGLAFYQQIRLAGGAVSVQGNAYLWPGLGVALVAILAAWLELGKGAAKTGSPWLRRRIWVEFALIFALGLAFRAVFLFVPPTISHDAYRYVWDAHLVSHGVSPYLYPASDPALTWLRDRAIWPKLDWPNSPTIYPPGAELLFWLVSSIAPLNITAMQLAMVACDLGTGFITLLLLLHNRLDPRRIIVYWWNPIPILEFVYSAHVDAAATLCVALALLLALGRWRWARFLSGAALAMAVLIKLYPLLFVVALLRRRDWGFLAGLCLTLVLVPLPFLHLGLGNGGFLTTYFSQRFVDQGIIFRLITQLIVNRRWQFALQASVLALLTGTVFYLRVRRRLRAAAGMLALSAAWIVISPHLFPWYVGGLLPFLALYLRLPSPTTRWVSALSRGDLAGDTPELPLALWLFVLAMPFTYVVFTPGYNANLFLLFFAAPAAVAGVSLYRHCRSSAGRRLLRGRYAVHALSSSSGGKSIPPAAKE